MDFVSRPGRGLMALFPPSGYEPGLATSLLPLNAVPVAVHRRIAVSGAQLSW